MATLELERPDNWFQKQITQLHTARAEAFAEYVRLRNTDQLFAAEVIAWELYSSLTRTACDLTGSAIPIGIITRDAERKANVEEAVLKNTCNRCGFIWNIRQPRFVDGLCSSCLAKQEKVLRTGRLACQPWQGRFARDDVTPVNQNGEPVLPGHRLCKNSDCVNPKHIRKGRNQNG
jgi:hypothetical protein